MTQERRRNCRIRGAVVLAVSVGLPMGCASTYQARHATPTGFLGDYSQLKAGKGEWALLHYVQRDADFKPYNKILLDPVRLPMKP